MSDRDGDDRRLVPVCRRRERAKQSERLEVDTGEGQAREPARLDVALDELAMRDDELDAPHADAAARDTEPDAAAGQVVVLEELAQCIRESLSIAELAAADDAAR